MPNPPPPPPPPKFPDLIVQLFKDIPKGQRNDLTSLPKKIQERVDALTPQQRKLLEQLIAQQG